MRPIVTNAAFLKTKDPLMATWQTAGVITMKRWCAFWGIPSEDACKLKVYLVFKNIVFLSYPFSFISAAIIDHFLGRSLLPR